jgi:hypothetical protein
VGRRRLTERAEIIARGADMAIDTGSQGGFPEPPDGDDEETTVGTTTLGTTADTTTGDGHPPRAGE